MTALRVLLATSWGTPCGIAAHSELLIEYVRRADQEIAFDPRGEALDPAWWFDASPSVRALPHRSYDLVHLNHHDALHSRWTPTHVKKLIDAGTPVVITFHDTLAQLDACPKLKMLAQTGASIIVHEPVEGLDGQLCHYWRQGVPAAVKGPLLLEWGNPFYMQQPILGTIGFNFPWKNYDRLAQLTASLGWGLLIVCPQVSATRLSEWRAVNPAVQVVTGFVTDTTALMYLAACDATTFMYECANTGTSGAIRLGIAARKPVLALQTCRQFRDLFLDPLGRIAIGWVEGWDHLRQRLTYHVGAGRFDARTVALAQQESWGGLGQRYAALYRSLTVPT